MINLLMSLEIDLVMFIANMDCEQTTNFFSSLVLFGVIFFPKSCLKVGGAAYTEVRLIHESLR